MDKLFNNDSEFHDLLPGEKSFSLEQIQPSIDDVIDRFIVPITGRAHVDVILADIKSEAALSDQKKKIIELTRSAVAHLVMANSTSDLDVKATANGFTVSKSEDFQVASAERVRRYIEKRSLDGSLAIDRMVAYLEGNVNSFNEYKDSDERKNQLRNFINTTAQLKKHLVPAPGRLVLDTIRPVIAMVEEDYLIPCIGQELYDHLKELIEGGNPDFGVYAPLIPMIEAAVANYAMDESLETLNLKIDQNYGVYISFFKNANEPLQSEPVKNVTGVRAMYKQRGNRAMEKLAAELKNNASTYTLYYESEAYTAPENTEHYLKADDTTGGMANFGF